MVRKETEASPAVVHICQGQLPLAREFAKPETKELLMEMNLWVSAWMAVNRLRQVVSWS